MPYSIYSSLGRHLGFSYSLAIMNNAAINIYLQFCMDACFQFSWVNRYLGAETLFVCFFPNMILSKPSY